MRFFSYMSILVGFFLASGIQQAEARPWGEMKLGGAIWNIMDGADRNALHGAYILPPLSSLYSIQPSVLVIWADEGQHYFAAGLHKTFYQQGAFSTALAFHAGLVDSPEALGDNVEFYSALSARYQLSAQWATEIEIGHISNGGLGEKNPGSEGVVLSLRYSL
ncbi:acyloxyacyl hydrolase [Salinimonas sp. HHU 13199]|uniref:Acyloxyacyl hydrolase n=1 Tax=Salinimonas profundi TaxID=2729140 RepID=A0ABR8LIQ4_9ALTE|nr:acyloxyacyl hydrolase [Salinimonas profundi]MBD3584187.1 acyloxyacyl hydrolase [Salinimonas profundi]